MGIPRPPSSEEDYSSDDNITALMKKFTGSRASRRRGRSKGTTATSDSIICNGEVTNGTPPHVFFRGVAYDISKFQHPGGKTLLKEAYGSDVTEIFEAVGHSARALSILEKCARIEGIVVSPTSIKVELVALKKSSSLIPVGYPAVHEETSILSLKTTYSQDFQVPVESMVMVYSSKLCAASTLISHLPREANGKLKLYIMTGE